ncbi:hypothetical protein OC842_002951 [Tilletia horrida]|uniref:Uncharacterized protein n=1 Tax=Tilletia horrida TaxID=155126 RepID=A0AAN6GED9_9BASI|nr:hypothetical protein OC842_002951 [Tilletia horrida]
MYGRYNGYGGRRRDWDGTDSDDDDDYYGGGGGLDYDNHDSASYNPTPTPYAALSELSTALGNVQPQPRPVLRSFEKEADWLPASPGLAIAGIGAVALPIVDTAQVDGLSRVSIPPPQSRLGTSSSPLKIDASKVSFANSKWAAGIRTAETVVGMQLGIPVSGLVARLAKLRLHRPGDSIARGKDSDSSAGSVARMIVQLPSSGSGGHLLVYREALQQPICHRLGDEDGDARFSCHIAVYPEQCEVAFSPITEGYRLSVEYTISYEGPNPFAQSSVDPPPIVKDAIVRAMTKVANAQGTILYFFRHGYEGSDIEELGSKALKPADSCILSALQQAGVTSPACRFAFYLAFASFYRHEHYDSDGEVEYDGWEVNGGMDLDDCPMIQCFYSLDGKPIRSRKYVEIDLQERTVLNPGGRSWSEMWDGQPVKSFPRDVGDPTQSTEHYKYILVGWPQHLDTSRMFNLGGEAAAFDAMMAQPSALSAAQVNDFLARVEKTKRDHASYPNEDAFLTRNQMLKMIVERPELHDAVLPFLERADLRLLLGGSHHYKPLAVTIDNHEPGLASLLALISSDALWRSVPIRRKVQSIFSYKRGPILKVLEACLEARFPAWKWEPFVYLLVQAEPRANQKAEPLDLGKLWRVAIEIKDSRLCAALVGEALNPHRLYPSAAISDLVKMLEQEKQLRPALFETKRELLMPLLRARETELQAQLPEGGHAVPDWRRPSAVHSRSDIQDFLHGPEQEFLVHNFNGIAEARAFCQQEQALAAACTLEPGGRGKDAWVLLVKKVTAPTGPQAALAVLKELMAPGPPAATPIAPWDTPELRFHLQSLSTPGTATFSSPGRAPPPAILRRGQPSRRRR